MPYSEHQVIRAGADTPLSALATPDLPRGAIEQSELARTVLGEIAEQAKAEAQAQGYAVGWAQGRREAQRVADETAREAQSIRREAETRRQAEHDDAVRALARAAEQVRGMLETLCETIEEQSTELAWALTKTLVGHEVSVATGADVVQRVLSVLPRVPTGVVRLHPAMAADPVVRELVTLGLDVRADPLLERADALVDAHGAVTDLRIGAALERVRAVLLDPREVARAAAEAAFDVEAGS